MSWPATARYDEEPAPAGLGFVQDFMNTIAAGKPRTADLLETPETAEAWLRQSLGRWSEATGSTPPAEADLGEYDWKELRAFRDDLRSAVSQPHDGALPALAALHTAAVALRLDQDGHVRMEPRGTGWRRIAALALIEVHLAQQAGIWQRLKMCRNERCATLFYDRSRNNSGVWHNVKMCGNAANLRAYRSRQRARNAS